VTGRAGGWAVAGTGAVASIGADVPAIYTALLAGRTGLAPLRGFAADRYRARQAYEIDDRPAPGADEPGRATRWLLDAVGQALADAGVTGPLGAVPVLVGTGLRVLLGLAGNGVVVALTAQDYIGFVLSTLIAFGVSFELPLVLVALNLVGVLSYAALAKGRRWIFFLTIVLAAVVTPTQDPFTMLAMALPMCVLFEGAIQIARVVDKRRARRNSALHFRDLPDDQPSPLDPWPSDADEVAPVE